MLNDRRSAVMLARLIINESDHGLYWFIVPLRCRRTGQLLPGVCVSISSHAPKRFFVLRCLLLAENFIPFGIGAVW